MFSQVKRFLLGCEFKGTNGTCKDCMPSSELSMDLFYCGRYKVLKYEGS